MSAKALNKKNLLDLGTDRLAELLIEVTKGRADMQRRLRLELSAHQGADDVARDIRKRYASIRQATGYLSRKTHRTFAKEIRSLIDLIESRVAPTGPDLAFDLFWELLHLATGVFDRTNDNNGTLREAFHDALPALSRLAPNLTYSPETLAETLLETLRHDRSGIFAQGVFVLSPALGPSGLEHLKQLATADRGQWAGLLLRNIADVQGDVDAYIARFAAKQLTDGAVAIDVATRLLKAGRADEALAIVQSAKGAGLEDVQIACLEALGRKDDLRQFLWDSFDRRPDSDRLRRYLKLLPDFDDIEAEDQARTLAQRHPNLHAALKFFIDWPDHPAAASLVQSRYDELDGDRHDLLAHLAEVLDAGFALSSALLRRKIILSALKSGKAAGDRLAADQVMACLASDAAIADYGAFPDHVSFVERLRRTYGRRRAFWARIA